MFIFSSFYVIIKFSFKEFIVRRIKVMVTIKSKQEIEKMREACKIAILTQKAIEEAIKPRNFYLGTR